MLRTLWDFEKFQMVNLLRLGGALLSNLGIRLDFSSRGQDLLEECWSWSFVTRV